MYVKDDQVIFTMTNAMSKGQAIHPTKVFQAFYTGDISRHHQGGLGLAIVKSLMKKMGGHVEVSVQEGLFTINCFFQRVNK